jgi:hypothetical protein
LYNESKGVKKMENIQKEWKLYVKKILFEGLYNENLDENVINFLKNYKLLEVKILKRKEKKLKMEVIFGRKSDIIKLFVQKVEIISEFSSSYTSSSFFHWTIPEEFNISQLEDILDSFEIQNFVKEED